MKEMQIVKIEWVDSISNGGWEIYPHPTRAQIDKMFDLTGYIYE